MSRKLTTQEVAQELGYDVEHVRRLLRLGAMRGERFNRVWMVDCEEVERVKALQSKGGRFYHGKTSKKGEAIEQD